MGAICLWEWELRKVTGALQAEELTLNMLLGRALLSTSGESAPFGGRLRVLVGGGFWEGS